MSFPVYCDMTTDGGGWLVFQRRIDGTEDFNRNWTAYENGFGNREKEFWLGNYKLYMLTSQGKYHLRVDLEDFEFNKAFAKYSQFSVAGPMDDYRLTLSGFTGSKIPLVRDTFAPIHSNHTFSTKDYGDKIICANSYNGGWWFNHCHAVHLNGVYRLQNIENAAFANGIIWSGWKGNGYSLKFSEMKFRPVK
ncbi:ficolin-1-A-like [Liolophura sinensis]|uniref:ficolin-1-A-like n=1 Tax=Liolophura sinensis TaxID=3198878 RepID=UPI00315936E0